VHSHAAAREVKDGRKNDLRERLAGDPAFGAVAGRLDDLLDGRRYVGRAPEQVEEYLAAEVDGLLARHAAATRTTSDVRV
jgi:adenylosuccinate lyase